MKKAYPYHPIELLFEILFFLKRSEIEKCQLVNSKWQKRINSWTWGPLRSIETFVFKPTFDKCFTHKFGFQYAAVRRMEICIWEGQCVNQKVNTHTFKNTTINQIDIGLDYKTLSLFRKISLDSGKLLCKYLNIYHFEEHEIPLKAQFKVRI